MRQPMTRSRAGAIRAVGLSAGALLLVAAGAMAVSPGVNPADVKPGDEVRIPELPARQEKPRIYPDEIAEWISTAYRHDFEDETTTPEQAQQTPTPAAGSPVRLVGVIGAGDQAMAIVGLDAQQLLLAPGESGPDFRIEEIHDDHIVIVRGGVRSEVRLGERQGPLAADIRPASLLGAAGAAVAGSQTVGRGDRADARTVFEGREDAQSARRRELEEQRRAAAAQRALEMTGTEDGNMGVPGAGNGNLPSAAGPSNGPSNGPGMGGQTGGRPARQPTRTGGGASNN